MPLAGVKQNMSADNIEDRIAKLERTQRKLAEFCGTLLTRIHQLDKNMGRNLGQLAEAIKDPEHFDLEDYQKQIARADFNFDQIDAAIPKLDLPQKPNEDRNDSD